MVTWGEVTRKLCSGQYTPMAAQIRRSMKGWCTPRILSCFSSSRSSISRVNRIFSLVLVD